MVRGSTKLIPNQAHLQELFYPSDPTNIESNFLVEEFGLVWVDSIIKEFLNKKKATHNYLSTIEGIYSWDKSIEAERKASIGLKANNNISELSFSRLIENVD